MDLSLTAMVSQCGHRVRTASAGAEMIMNIEKEYRYVLNAMTKPGGASNDRIEAAEQELAVVFPPPYREFLAECGACLGTGFEVAGICDDSNDHEPPMWRSVLQWTKQLRSALGDELPDDLIPISDDGQDTTFYIDTKSEAGRVIACGPGVEGQVVAASFKGFVIRASRGEL
jgi:hypothetical protein